MAIQFCSEDTYNRRLNTSSTGSANGASGANGGGATNSNSNLSSSGNGAGAGLNSSSTQDFSALHDEKLYSSAAQAAAAAAAAVSSAVPEVASVLSPSQLVGYPGLQKSSPSPVGSAGGPLDPSEVFCPTSAAAAAAAAFSFPGYSSGPASSECTPKTEDTKDN